LLILSILNTDRFECSKNRANLKDVIGKSKEGTRMQDNSLYKLGGICSILSTTTKVL
jgi:hypothetical protein